MTWSWNLNKEPREDIFRRNEISCSWIARNNTVKVGILTKATYTFNASPIKLLTGLFSDLDRALPKFIWKSKKPSVLVRVSIIVKRHSDQKNVYKGQLLIGLGLQFQRFSPLSSWQEGWELSNTLAIGGSWSFHPVLTVNMRRLCHG